MMFLNNLKQAAIQRFKQIGLARYLIIFVVIIWVQSTHQTRGTGIIAVFAAVLTYEFFIVQPYSAIKAIKTYIKRQREKKEGVANGNKDTDK